VSNVAKQFLNVSIFKIPDVLCDKDFCYAEKDGKRLYSDSDHLSDDGSDYVAQFLAAIILATLKE
jgi:hypothetical protein